MSSSDQQQNNKEKIDDLYWNDNSRVMYEKMLSMQPFFVRPIARSKMMKLLKEKTSASNNDSNTVTEDIMYDVVKETTPTMYVDKAIKALDELKTTTATTSS